MLEILNSAGKKRAFLAIGSLLLVGCTKIGIGIANLPASFSSNEIIKDIAYGAQGWQKLDIHIPQQAKTRNLPVIVFFYGGRWSEGSKDMYAFVGETFAGNNYITVIPDYSKYPRVKFPAFVEDGAKAVAWVHNHIEQYGGNPDKLYISGHSSGAHIGGLIAADKRYLQSESKSTAIISAFAGLAGPYDFVPKAEDLKAIFGPPENYPQMQVTHFIEGNEPPMLLLWGDEDTAVWRRNIDLLAQEIRQKQGVVKTRIYPGVDHVGILAGLTWIYKARRPVLGDVTIFFEEYGTR